MKNMDLYKSDVMFCYMPIENVVRANAVDPATVAAVVKAALELIQQRNFSAWQDAVVDKLDEISHKLDEVIRLIQQLRGYIDERITRESIDLFEGEINARRMTVDQVLSGVSASGDIDDATRLRLVRIMDELDVPLWQLMNWKKFGFDSYPAIIVGVVTKLLLLTITNRPVAESRVFARKTIENFFNPAVSSFDERSLEYLRNSIASYAIQQYGEFSGYLNKWYQIFYMEREVGTPDPDGYRNVRVSRIYVRATGSVESGVDVAVNNKVAMDVGWYPRAGDGMSVEKFKADLDSQISGIKNLMVREAGVREHIKNIIDVRQILEVYASGDS